MFNSLLPMALSTTIISAVAAFLLGQYALKLIIEPLLALRAHIGAVGCQLIYFSDSLTNSSTADGIRQELRKSASRLVELLHGPIIYEPINRCFCLPREKEVLAAASELIGLSNTLGKMTPDDPKERRIAAIRQLLRLHRL